MEEREEKLYSFGVWVRQRRKGLGLTQAALAHRVGCAEVTIRKVEADTMRPSPEMAEVLASKLDIPLPDRSAFIEAGRGGRGGSRLGSDANVPPLPNSSYERSSSPRSNVVDLSFDFPEPVKVPCEQYLLYFV